MKRLLTMLLCLGLVGCATVPDYQRMSSGRIGCAPNDVQITDINHPFPSTTTTWTADCKGEKYYCTETQQDYSAEVSCTKGK